MSDNIMSDNIKGKLSDINITNVLAMLHHGSKDGVLKLKFPDERLNCTLAFYQGFICRLQALLPAKFTDILIDLGGKEEELEHLKQLDTESKTLQKTDGKVYNLVERAFYRRLEMSLVPILERQDGSFGFYFTPSTPLLLPGINPIGLALDVAKRIDEIKRFSTLGARLTLDDPFVAQLSHFVRKNQRFSAKESLVLGLFARSKQLLEVAQLACLTWDELLKIVISLWEEDYIKPLTPKSLLNSHGDGVLDFQS